MNYLDKVLPDKQKQKKERKECSGGCGMRHVDFLFTHYDRILHEAMWMCDDCHRKVCDFDDPDKSFKGKTLSSIQASI